MTATASKVCDVFISHSMADFRLAAEIAEGLESVGLETFHAGGVDPGEDIEESIWQALAESRAVIVIVSPDMLQNAMGMVEIGAAAVWNKPVYLLINGPSSLKLPAPLRSYPAYPLGRLDEVIQKIRSGFQPLTETERGLLADVYTTIRTPTDQLNQSPAALQELTKKFNRRARQHLSGERLLSELLRMRKQGELPSVRAGA